MSRFMNSISIIIALVAFAASALSVPKLAYNKQVSFRRNPVIRGTPFNTQPNPQVHQTFNSQRQHQLAASRSQCYVSMSTKTLEREVVIPSTVDYPRQKKKSNSKASRISGAGSSKWEVRIYNDKLNTREHVARCLVQFAGLSESMAYQTMMKAHHNGMAVVGRWVFEQAEIYHDGLKENGIICDLVPVNEND